MADLAVTIVAAKGAAIHCACGGSTVAMSDGDGVVRLWCERCLHWVATIRRAEAG